MELSLVPLEGENALSEEQKKRARRRARHIPPEELSVFDNEDRKQIKQFLTLLVTLTEQFHHDMKQQAESPGDTGAHQRQMIKLQKRRRALFKAPPPAVAEFIELLNFYAMEPWPEFEMMIAGVRGEDLKHYYETKLKSAVGAYHTDVEDNVDQAQDERLEAAKKCRITPQEIKELVWFNPLENLVKQLVDTRQLMSGDFWDVGHYDL